ncbi:exopolyphosphatase, partial [Amycolatopsis sp. NPDC051373]
MRKVSGSAAGALDVGSFSARLVVLEPGGTPLAPALSHQTRLRLDRELNNDCRLSPRGIAAISAAVADGATTAARHDVHNLFPFATSSIRDAANATEVVRRVRRDTGVELQFLSGRREA